MKKFFTIAALVLMLTMLLGLAAGASDFDGIASELKEIGLFQGTDTGFELDREPKRVEAAVMLVRLLGAEEKALAEFEAGEVEHPFEDVPAWADAYVAWLKTNNLTNGISETEFGSEALCNAQMYCTFVLRALGYSDAEEGQFTYDKALDFAQSVGLYEEMLFGDTFLRDDVVAISYQSLVTKVNGGEKSLLEKLIEDGAVDAEAAKPLLDKADLYREFSAAMEAVNSQFDVKAMGMDLVGTITMVLDDQAAEPIDFAAAIQLVADEANIAFAADVTVNNEAMKMWLKDDAVYMESNGQKIKMAMEGYSDLVNKAAEVDDGEQALEAGFYLIDKVEKTVDAEQNTQYTLTMSSAIQRISKVAMAEANELGVEGLDASNALDISEMALTAKLDKDGEFKNLGVKYGYNMELVVMDQVIAVKYDADVDCTIKQLEEGFAIEFPDFTEFVDMSELAAELAAEEQADADADAEADAEADVEADVEADAEDEGEIDAEAEANAEAAPAEDEEVEIAA